MSIVANLSVACGSMLGARAVVGCQGYGNGTNEDQGTMTDMEVIDAVNDYDWTGMVFYPNYFGFQNGAIFNNFAGGTWEPGFVPFNGTAGLWGANLVDHFYEPEYAGCPIACICQQAPGAGTGLSYCQKGEIWITGRYWTYGFWPNSPGGSYCMQKACVSDPCAGCSGYVVFPVPTGADVLANSEAVSGYGPDTDVDIGTLWQGCYYVTSNPTVAADYAAWGLANPDNCNVDFSGPLPYCSLSTEVDPQDPFFGDSPP